MSRQQQVNNWLRWLDAVSSDPHAEKSQDDLFFIPDMLWHLLNIFKLKKTDTFLKIIKS